MWYLVRHPETEWNQQGRYQGWRDNPLSVLGHEQCQQLIKELGQLSSVEAVLASDLSRCLAVAQPVARQLRKPLLVLPDLRELNFGVWEGLTFSEIGAAYPKQQTTWLHDPRRTAPPGGETLEQLKLRVEGALTPYLGRDIIVISHGGVIATVQSLWLGQQFLLPAAGTCLAVDPLPQGDGTASETQPRTKRNLGQGTDPCRQRRDSHGEYER